MCGTGRFEAVKRVVGVVFGGLADVVDGGGSRGERERDGDVALTALEEGFQFCCRQPLNLAQTGVAVGVVAVEDADVAAAVEHHIAGLPVDVFVACGQRESQRPQISKLPLVLRLTVTGPCRSFSTRALVAALPVSVTAWVTPSMVIFIVCELMAVGWAGVSAFVSSAAEQEAKSIVATKRR